MNIKSLNAPDLAVALTVYRPSDAVLDNIQSTILSSKKVYVYRNSPDAQISCSPSVVFLGTGENMGLSVAINKMVKEARNDGFGWVLLLDQDTKLNPDVFTELNSFSPRGDELAYYIMSEESGVLAKHKFFTTSGLMVNTKLFFEVGGYSGDLFVDGLDYDFRLKAIYSGWDIHLLPLGRYFDHQTFQDGENYSFFNRKLNIRAYSSSRKKEINYFFRTRLINSFWAMDLRIFAALSRSYLIYIIGAMFSLVSGGGDVDKK